MHIPRILSAISLSLTAVLITAAQNPSQSDAKKYIEKSESAWAEAGSKGDAATIKRILADDFIGIAPDGSRYDKAKEIADTANNRLMLLSADGTLTPGRAGLAHPVALAWDGASKVFVAEDAGVAERTTQGLGLLGAGLFPQTDAEQDQEREHGRRHQSQQLRADPHRRHHHDCSDRPTPAAAGFDRCRSKPGSLSHDTDSL